MDGPRHHHLDPRVKLVWFLPGLGIILFLWMTASVLLFLLQPSTPIFGFSGASFSAALLVFVLIFLAGPLYAYFHLEYLSFTFELAPREVIIRQGVFTRETAVIPYERIQNINTRRTVVERFLGLATLVIDTAGTNPQAAEGLLPGVSKKEILVREIMDRVEKARGGRTSDASSRLSLGTHGDDLPSERELLADILKEIVQLRHSIHTLGDTRKADEKSRPSPFLSNPPPPAPSGRAKDSKP